MMKRVCLLSCLLSGIITDVNLVEAKEGIEDMTGTNLTNLRRTIYLTIMNALGYEEAVHKLLKVQLEEGQEIELVKSKRW